jgi:hypothetical protein
VVAAATDEAFGGSDVRPPCRRAVGAARGGSAAGPEVRRLLSACEGSWAAFNVTNSSSCVSSVQVIRHTPRVALSRTTIWLQLLALYQRRDNLVRLEPIPLDHADGHA